ncbi:MULTISPECIES: nucleotidyltransferase family protein [unclassified Acinetobacter]|uniref:nucleotidyltransferase family protein n=1 Tax=unclassified Acinetobacter TaxID=196816 RepID=UPI00211F30EE|nr:MULTISPECIES: nucleotidyltransferase family protein [unclassified Acinetobacter]
MAEPIQALKSIEHALSLWPETATAIAVKLDDKQQIQLIAPLGLDDLFELNVRWNPRLVSQATFLQRVQQKQFLQRWPKLKLLMMPEA